jgi:RNA polymerase II subunit A small phosphatase-like protein
VERPTKPAKLQIVTAEEDNKEDPSLASPPVDGTTETPRTKLGKIFSRQYTPTVPKATELTKENRGAAQSPRGKNKLGAYPEEAMPQDEEVEEVVQETTDEHGRTVWQVIRRVFTPAPSDANPVPQKPAVESLLGVNPTDKKHCLVLDLDETLVHSSFKPVGKCDFVLSINMEGVIHKVYVLKRPGVDEFLEEMAKYFELVVFTASLDKYANPLLDLLDPKKLITGRLFREHCSRRGQMYIKDLDRLGRSLENSLIIDNSPHSYALHPFHAVPIISWFDDPRDTELFDMMPFLRDLTKISDVSAVLDASKPWRASHRALSRLIEQLPTNDQHS